MRPNTKTIEEHIMKSHFVRHVGFNHPQLPSPPKRPPQERRATKAESGRQRIHYNCFLAILICCAALTELSALRTLGASGVYSPLGQAGLTNVGTRLLVSNIGSSGQDGVAVDLGEAQFGVVSVEVADPNQAPDGAEIQARALGVVDGRPGRPISTLSAVAVPDGWELHSDFSPLGMGPVSAVIYDGDKIVAQVNNLTATVARVTSPIRVIKFDPIWPMCRFCPWAIIDLPDRPFLTPWGGQSVQGTRIAIIPGAGSMPNPEDPDPEPWGPLGPVSRIELVGKNLDSLAIAGVQIGQFHQAHQALGQTSLRAVNGNIVLNNPGNSLEDGVDIQPDNANALDVRWSPLPDSASGMQRALRLSAWGTLDTTAPGKPAEFLGAVQAIDAGPGLLQIDLQQPQANASSSLVAIFRQGNLVGSFHADGEVVAMASSMPYGGSIHAHPFGPGPYCLWLDWPHLVDFFQLNLPGSVKGDQIRITPDTLPGHLAKLDHLRLNLAGIPELVLTSERHDQEGLLFAGNDHTPVGNASLAITASSESNAPPVLSVEKLGTTGQNGVRILAGQAQSVGVTLNGLQPSKLTAGATLQLEPRGEVAGLPGQSMGRLLIEAMGQETRIQPDFSTLGVQDYYISVYDGDRLVATTAPSGSTGSAATRTGVTASVVLPSGLVISDALFELFRFHFDYWCLRHRCWELILVPKPFPWPWPGPDPRELPEFFVDGIGLVRGDRVSFMPADSPIRSGDLAHELLITGRGLESFQVAQESLRQFGQPHLASGQAEFLANGETLTLANLGTSGDDGVDFVLDRGLEFSLKFQAPFNPDPTPWTPGEPNPQPNLQLLARGSIAGVAGRSLGSLNIMGNSNRLAIIPDYTPLNSPTSTVEIYQRGQLARRLTGQVGEVAYVPGWPIGCGKLGGSRIPQFPPPPPCFILNWPDLVPVTLADGAVVMGDEIRVLTEAPRLHLDYLETFGLRTVGFKSFSIADELSVPLMETASKSIRLQNGVATIQFPTEPEVNYLIRHRPSLGAQYPWQTLTTIWGDGSVKTVPHQVGNAWQGYYQIIPLIGRPDLVVPEIRTTGVPRVLSDGRTEVPVRVIVRNQGTAPAGIFKSSVEYTSPANADPFTVAFSVTGQADIWYPWTSAPLGPGEQQTFNGTLTLHKSARGQTVSVHATADSCSGDEFMPDWCRVLESNEANNESSTLSIVLP
jgi:hypothetical protein